MQTREQELWGQYELTKLKRENAKLAFENAKAIKCRSTGMARKRDDESRRVMNVAHIKAMRCSLRMIDAVEKNGGLRPHQVDARDSYNKQIKEIEDSYRNPAFLYVNASDR